MQPEKSNAPDMVVRRFTRHDVAFDAELTIAPEQEQLVQFSAALRGRDGALDVSLTDVSSGGMGLMSAVFVPRGARVRVRALSPLDHEKTLFEANGEVTRVVMTDRRPGYLIGASYTDRSPAFEERLGAFLAALDGDEPAGAGESAAGVDA